MGGFGNLGGSDSRSRSTTQRIEGQYASGGGALTTTVGRGNIAPGGQSRSGNVTVGKGGSYAPVTNISGVSSDEASKLLQAVSGQANRDFASPATFIPPEESGVPKWILFAAVGVVAVLIFFLKRNGR